MNYFRSTKLLLVLMIVLTSRVTFAFQVFEQNRELSALAEKVEDLIKQINEGEPNPAELKIMAKELAGEIVRFYHLDIHGESMALSEFCMVQIKSRGTKGPKRWESFGSYILDRILHLQMASDIFRTQFKEAFDPILIQYLHFLKSSRQWIDIKKKVIHSGRIDQRDYALYRLMGLSEDQNIAKFKKEFEDVATEVGLLPTLQGKKAPLENPHLKGFNLEYRFSQGENIYKPEGKTLILNHRLFMVVRPIDTDWNKILSIRRRLHIFYFDTQNEKWVEERPPVDLPFVSEKIDTITKETKNNNGVIQSTFYHKWDEPIERMQFSYVQGDNGSIVRFATQEVQVDIDPISLAVKITEYSSNYPKVLFDVPTRVLLGGKYFFETTTTFANVWTQIIGQHTKFSDLANVDADHKGVYILRENGVVQRFESTDCTNDCLVISKFSLQQRSKIIYLGKIFLEPTDTEYTFAALNEHGVIFTLKDTKSDIRKLEGTGEKNSPKSLVYFGMDLQKNIVAQTKYGSWYTYSREIKEWVAYDSRGRNPMDFLDGQTVPILHLYEHASWRLEQCQPKEFVSPLGRFKLNGANDHKIMLGVRSRFNLPGSYISCESPVENKIRVFVRNDRFGLERPKIFDKLEEKEAYPGISPLIEEPFKNLFFTQMFATTFQKEVPNLDISGAFGFLLGHGQNWIYALDQDGYVHEFEHYKHEGQSRFKLVYNTRFNGFQGRIRYVASIIKNNNTPILYLIDQDSAVYFRYGHTVFQPSVRQPHQGRKFVWMGESSEGDHLARDSEGQTFKWDDSGWQHVE